MAEDFAFNYMYSSTLKFSDGNFRGSCGKDT